VRSELFKHQPHPNQFVVHFGKSPAAVQPDTIFSGRICFPAPSHVTFRTFQSRRCDSQMECIKMGRSSVPGRCCALPSSAIQRVFGAFSLALCLCISPHTLAATYYIDVVTGSDNWSGLQPNRIGVPASDGPWQTLGRLTSVTLLPGDLVRLKCGQRWGETLKITQSGTVSAPISVNSYPDGCTTPPMMDGTVAIPSHSWSLARGSIYRATLPMNLVNNGQLDRSIAGWYAWASAGIAAIAHNSACPGSVGGCLVMTSSPSGWSLAIGPSFPIQGGLPHTLTFQAMVPAGVTVIANIRRSGPTNYDSAGVQHSFTGTGGWQNVSLPFKPTASMPNARFDLTVATTNTTVRLRAVQVSPVTSDPVQLLMGGRAVQVAHHPNRGFNTAVPKSMYLRNAADGNRVTHANGTGSTYLTTGPDLVLPTGASLTPGLVAHMRSDNWHIDRRPITGVAGARLHFDTPTTYPFMLDWGYYLTGAAWMLDASDEWFYDTSSKSLTVWMPDGAAPANRLAFSHLSVGIDLTSTRFVTVTGLAVRGTVTGVSLFRTTRATLSNVTIEDTVGAGIDAKNSYASRIENSRISRTGLDAIEGTGVVGVPASSLTVSGNTISDSGVLVVGGNVVSLPSPSIAAIQTGADAVITRNTIRRAGYHGIRTYGTDGSVTSNYVSEACLVLDDCGGIYASWTGNRAIISGNLVEGVRGDFSGTPYNGTRAVGIYIDEHAQQIQISNNTVRDADYGIQIHNAFSNTITGNTLFGNRRLQLWMQEQSRSLRADGDIYSNAVSNNVFVPTAGGPSVLHESYFNSTWDFGTYSGNTYSALLSSSIVSEIWATGSAAFTFPEWRSAVANGSARNSDSTGREVTPSGYAAFRSTGPNAVPNGSLSNGRVGWSYWNRTAPFGQLYVETCTVGPCLRFVAGSTVSLLSSPNFPVTQDQWYRVSFDARSGAAGQGIAVIVREGGGGSASYESVMGPSSTFNGSTTWTRYSFVFKATRSVRVDDPLTGGLGTRVDFERVQPGNTLSVANLEMVPLSPVEVGLRIEMLTNPNTSATIDVDCPTRATAPTLCAQFVRFSDGAAVSWPYRLSPLGKEVMFTRDPTLLDADRDGIPDAQDSCPNTTSGSGTKANGCAIGQAGS
jgi:parallel beta-helix repeat protein